MTRLLLAACSLLLCGLPAHAEDSRSDAGAAASGGNIVLAQRGPGYDGGEGWRGRRDWRDQDSDDRSDRGADRGWGGGDRDGDRERIWRMHRMMGAGGERGLRIRMRRGDAAVDLRCPTASDYTACISAAGQLFDKLSGAAASTSAPSSGPSTPSAPSPTPGAPTR